MNLENKKTVLDDNASIYDHSTDKLSDKEKFKQLNKKQRWQQFKDYYLAKIVIGIIAAVLLVSFGYSVFKEKPKAVIHVAVSDGAMPMDVIERVTAEFGEQVITDPKKQEIIIDNSYSFNSNFYNSLEAYGVLHAVGELHVSIMPKTVFEGLAMVGYFRNIDESGVSREFVDSISDLLVYVPRNDESGVTIEGSEAPYGVIISDSFLYEGLELSEPVVLAIHASCKDDAICETFLRYILQK